MTPETLVDDTDALNDIVQFEISQEISILNARRPWLQGHSARTLFKGTTFRIVLISMDANSKLNKHHADGTISVHVLRGSLRLHIGEQTRDIAANGLLTIGASIEHDVEALEDSHFLLTMSWPDAEALDQLRKVEHRNKARQDATT